MGFYENYNFEGLQLLSKLNEVDYNNTPCSEMVQIIKMMKNNPDAPPIMVAEVGVGFGATTVQIVELLDSKDTYFAFDFQETLDKLKHDLDSKRLNVKCKVATFGNSHDRLDSYNWHLSNIIFQMRQQKVAGVFDVVYLDGAHSFAFDGLAVCLLKELVVKGGFLVLDDLHWTFASDPRLNMKGIMPEYQTKEKQIFRVQELFLSNDPYFEKLSKDTNWRGVFRKIANAPSR